jgi:antitoxin component YwqK of YwqJK toxin-antitoxin module
MKRNVLNVGLVIIFGFLINGCNETSSYTKTNAFDIKSAKEITMRDEMIYEKHSDIPFTGIGKIQADDQSKECVIMYVAVEKGVMHGHAESWSCDGSLLLKAELLHGKKEGKSESWDKNGHKTSELIYKNSAIISGWEKSMYANTGSVLLQYHPELYDFPEFDFKYINGKKTGYSMHGESVCEETQKLSFYENDKFIGCKTLDEWKNAK